MTSSPPSASSNGPSASNRKDAPVTVAINGRYLLASFGGVRRCAIEITQHLSQMRSDIVLLVPPSAVDQVPEGVPFRAIGRTGGPLWEQIELPLWLRRNGSPLLLNPANIAPMVYRPQISVQHDIAPSLRPQDFTFLFRVQWHLSVRWGMLRRGQTLVTSSDASRREIAERFGVAPETIDVVHLGADTLPVPEARPAPADPAVIVAATAPARTHEPRSTRWPCSPRTHRSRWSSSAISIPRWSPTPRRRASRPVASDGAGG